jgi:flagellar hook-associated protein 3 FlgL
MQFQAIGDLANHLALRGHNARVAAAVDRLSDEVASGRRADLSAAVGGNFRPLAAIDGDLALLARRQTAAAEAALRLDAEQSALTRVQDRAEATLGVLLTVGDIARDADLAAAERAAAGAFRDAVSALNGTVAGEALFAGVATDGAALADADAMLTALAAAVATETTAAGLHAAVHAWFTDAGGGYETVAYRGAAAARAPVTIGGGTVIAGGPTARDPAIRAILAPLAALTLSGMDAPGLGPEGRAELAGLARADLLNAGGGLTALRADTGARQEAVDRQQTANAAERGALAVARSAIADADPYQAAIELEAATAQLEILYTVTARLSRLSLARFLG